MIKFVISLLLIIEGIRANDDVYRCPEDDCKPPPFPMDFPQDKDDLQKLCTPVIELLQCKVRVTEGCEPPRVKEVELGSRILSTVRTVCSEDTLLHRGIRATPQYLQCRQDECEDFPFPVDFPQNNADLQSICKPIMKTLKCKIRFIEGCVPYMAEEAQLGYRILYLIEDICSEDTLLHAAIVENLQCFSKILYDDTRHCSIEKGTTENKRVQRFTEALVEKGIISFNDNENDISSLHGCIETMFFFACNSQNIESKCGIAAMGAYVRIIRSIGPAAFETNCVKTFGRLPAIVRLYKLVGAITNEEKRRK